MDKEQTDDVYEWDEAKRSINRNKHGVDFSEMNGFVWEEALIEPDPGQDYGEERFRALGPINSRLYVLIYTLRNEQVRLISLRKATRQEFHYYVQSISSAP